MQPNDDNTTNWGIVELMGHKVVAGRVSKSEMIGAPLMRVDVPATSTFPEFTQFYGTSAIYCVTFVSEQVARLTAEQTKVNPVSVYVPELITREQMEAKVQDWSERVERLREMKGLPAGRTTCQWTQDDHEDDSHWETSCGHAWQFEDGNPADNNVEYCMYCGHPVTTAKEVHLGTEEEE